ncbi:type II secretion system F family protein [Cohnella sp. GCM10020058]|uniref:type II secretion system F family protein n=1 Tax=Cohnella sp. GCM10020058 TaxID=3317330 RepID=UPI0036401621
MLLLAGYAALLAHVYRRRAWSKPRHLLLDPMHALIGSVRLWPRIAPRLHREQTALSALSGGRDVSALLSRHAAMCAAYAYAALLAGAMLGWIADRAALLGLGAVMAGLLPLIKRKELYGRLEMRRHEIVMELPEMLSRLLLMVGAGENVLRALERCLDRPAGAGARRGDTLYAELEAAVTAVKRGESFVFAWEEFGRRCAVPEARMFATTLLMNARRGGDTFVTALRELSRILWEKRKAAARTLGERASSRLAFPLAIIFLIILVLVGTPSILLMATE